MNDDDQLENAWADDAAPGRRQTTEVIVRPKPKLQQKRAAPSLALSTPKRRQSTTSNPNSER